MHTSITEPEWHPWLKLFTIMAIPEGLLFTFPNCLLIFEIGNAPNPLGALLIWVVSILLSILPGAALIWASVHTLQATDYFRRWNSGVSQRDKWIGYVTIYFGVMMTIALFFVAPFMRFITDTVGGGLGVSRRS